MENDENEPHVSAEPEFSESLTATQRALKEAKLREITRQRSQFINQTVLLFLCQVMLATLLFREVPITDIVFPADVYNVIAKFICAIVLHMELQDEGYQGLNMMKYALNHKWRFEHPWTAFIAGFL
jgi:hypothetical protein